MTVVPISPQATLPTEPFVTVAEFKAHPTFLDVQNLRAGSALLSDQDAELFNILLMASEWAEEICDQPLQAHIQTDYGRNWIDQRGRLKVHADHAPVRTVLSYEYGTVLGQVTSVANPLCRIEDGRQIIVEPGGNSFSWSGSLAMGFGSAPSTVELYTTFVYVAGYANATLAAQAAPAATSITVTNSTGIYAGDVLRLWDPGKEESVVVASSWAGQATYPYTPATIPLVAPLANEHDAGVGVSGLGADAHLAVTYLAVDGLQRWGTSSKDWPGSRVKSATGKRTDQMTPWETKACRLLNGYRDVR